MRCPSVTAPNTDLKATCGGSESLQDPSAEEVTFKVPCTHAGFASPFICCSLNAGHVEAIVYSLQALKHLLGWVGSLGGGVEERSRDMVLSSTPSLVDGWERMGSPIAEATVPGTSPEDCLEPSGCPKEQRATLSKRGLECVCHRNAEVAPVRPGLTQEQLTAHPPRRAQEQPVEKPWQ